MTDAFTLKIAEVDITRLHEVHQELQVLGGPGVVSLEPSGACDIFRIVRLLRSLHFLIHCFHTNNRRANSKYIWIFGLFYRTLYEEYPFKCMFVRSGKLKSGERVSIRLLEDMVIDGQLVPKNTHLMAVCSIGSRLDLNVASIDLGGKIINLDYDAYDNDGTKGIYCPGISDRTASQAASTAVSGARSRLTSRIGRAAQDVVNTGLSLITLSGGETAVQVPAGYQFYLVKSRRK